VRSDCLPELQESEDGDDEVGGEDQVDPIAEEMSTGRQNENTPICPFSHRFCHPRLSGAALRHFAESAHP
jgi:hypothetical protein